jgi:C_GCAxxG_C_C family probable redox protein
LAVAEAYSIESEFIPKIATAFCSGLARSGDTCGAVSGALMGLSLVKGRGTPDVPVDETYLYVQKFLDKFKALHGSIRCEGLIGVDLNTVDGQTLYQKLELGKQCTEYVGQAAGIVMQLLAE